MRDTSWIAFALAFAVTVTACGPARGNDDVRTDREPDGHSVRTTTVDVSTTSLASGGHSEAEGGSAVATSGDTRSKATVGDVSGGAGSATTGDVTVNTKHRKNTPSVYAGSPDTTAPCWVGLSGGGAGSGWGVSGLFARRDKACLAMLQFHNLAKLGLYGPAAVAYCVKDANLWKPFESISACETQMKESLEIQTDNSPDTDEQVTYDEVSGLKYTEEEYLVATAETASAVERSERAEYVANEARARARSAEKTAQKAPQEAVRAVKERDDEVQAKLRAIKQSAEWKALYEKG